MNLKKVDSFLSRLSLMFRRYFLDMRLSYDFSDNEEIVQVTVSKISKGSGVALVPSAVFSLSDVSVRFLKLDMASDVDFAEYEVSSFFELRTVVLYVTYSLISAEHPDLTLFGFLSKILSAKIEGGADLLEHFLKANSVPYSRDPDYLYVYDYGNFQFYKDAVSLFSTESVRVVYKIDTEFSAYSVAALVFESVYATVLNADENEAKVFRGESFDNEVPIVDPDAEGGDFSGGFSDDGGFDEGGGGGNSFAPVEGGGGAGGSGLDSSGFEE